MEDNIRKKKNLAGIIIAIAAVIVLCVVLVAILIAKSVSPAAKLEKQLSLGAKYLNELDYDQAIVAYRTAIEIDPKSTDAYIGLADAYIGKQDYDEALAVLNEGYDQTSDDRIKDKIHEIEALIAQETPSDAESSADNGAEASEGQTDTGELALDQMFEVRGYIFATEDLIPDTIREEYSSLGWDTYGVHFEDGIILSENGESIVVEIADLVKVDKMSDMDTEAYLNVPCLFYGCVKNHENKDGPESDGGYHFDPYEYTFELYDIISTDEAIREIKMEEMDVSVFDAQNIDANNLSFEFEHHATEALDVRIAAWKMEPWTHEEIVDQYELYSDEWSDDEVVLLEPDVPYIQSFPLKSDEHGDVYVLLFGRNEDGDIVAYSVIEFIH